MSAIPTDAWEQPRLASPSTRAARTIEVAIFLFLVVPSLVLSLFVVHQGGLGFVIGALATICRDLALVLLILYFLWRNGESATRIGWVSKGAVREILLGVALFIPFFFITTLLELALIRLGLTSPKTVPSELRPTGPGQIALGFVLVCVVAVAEETIFRGYLLLRLGETFRSTAGAIILATLVFAIGHGYEGSAGVVTVGVMGALFALIYVWRGSLVAPIVMHFLQDFIGIVLVPLLGIR